MTFKKVCVMGLGYVGLPLVKAFIDKNIFVVGYDIDKNKIQQLKDKISYIDSIPDTDITKWIDSGMLFPTIEGEEMNVVDVDAIIVAVPTPVDVHNQPNLGYVSRTMRTIALHAPKGCLIVLESSSFPGTTQEMYDFLVSQGRSDLIMGYSPERVDPGTSHTVEATPKLVAGLTFESKVATCELYNIICQKIIPVDSCEIAEASKILENTYRSVNIALINEMKMVFDAMDIDIWKVIDAAATKPFGFTPFYPGPGVGGHCIPVDPYYLTHKAEEFDMYSDFISLAAHINDYMPRYTIQQLMLESNKQNKCLSECDVLVLGVAYKPDVADIRESPALSVIENLIGKCKSVSYYDPYVPQLHKMRKHNLKMVSAKSVNIPWGYDAIIICTVHSNYNEMSLREKLIQYSRENVVIDTRNFLGSKNNF